MADHHFRITFKPCHEIELRSKFDTFPEPTSIKDGFESFLRSGTQKEFVFRLRDQKPGYHIANANIEVAIDLRDVSAVIQTEADG